MCIHKWSAALNSDQIHGHWREVKGWALEQIGRVTQDHHAVIAGRRERLLGRLEASLAQGRRIAEEAGNDPDVGDKTR